MSVEEFQVVFHRGTAEVIRHCRKMVEDARQWAVMTKWTEDIEVNFNDAREWRQKYAQVQEWVTEMELSFHRCLLQLIQLASQSGEVQVWYDGEDSLFWRETKSGYHGGFIYHPKYADGEKRLPVGSWQLHT